MLDPRVYGVASGVDFPEAVVTALLDWSAGDPFALGQMTVLLNADRMRREVRSAFTRRGAVLLPRLLLVTEVDQLLPPGALPPSISSMRQRLELAGLVQYVIEADPTLAPRSSAYDLAESLLSLLDEMAVEGVSSDVITRLDVTDESGHWQRSQSFLGIVQQFLSSSGDGRLSGGQRAALAIEALRASWEASPPKYPIVVAGSTGSRGTTASLIQCVASLLNGRVILPGFDFDTPADVFEGLAAHAFSEDHPQARLAGLLDTIGVRPDAVRRLGPSEPDKERNRLVSLALRPAPVTDQWLSVGPKLGDLSSACKGMTLVEASSPRAEAEAIALIIRDALEADKRIAVITPDRVLTRQVEAALARWGVEPDDSGGKPLHLSPPGRLIRLIVGVLGQTIRPLDLIGLLSHPLAASGADRGSHLLAARRLEIELRKARAPLVTSKALLVPKEDTRDAAWRDWLVDWVAKLDTTPVASLQHRLAHVRMLAESLSAGMGGVGSGGLWAEAAGREALSVWESLEDAADAVDVITIPDFRYLIDSALSGESVRTPDVKHPNVMIWGTLEARVQGADLVILAGLNEGVWPSQPAADPWLNRSLRKQAGLLLPDRQIGLAAHDFQQAVGGSEVVITRSRRDSEAETVPSRWLNRLTNLLSGLPEQGGQEALQTTRLKGDAWLELAASLDRPDVTVEPVKRPSPAPLAASRPDRLSISDVQRLIRDPYAVYARRILQLYKLDPLMPLPDAGIRGSALHKIMEVFIKGIDDGSLSLSTDDLISVAEGVLKDLAWPAMAKLWRARIERIAEIFVQAEERRQDGTKQTKVEESGRIEIGDTGVTLVGKADRVDLQKDGRVAIYDYKSGGVKNAKEMHHFEPQLLLEALMAEAGGFDTIDATEAALVGYISLGRDAKSNAFPLDEGKDYDFTVSTIRDRLIALIEAYQDESLGYTSRRAMARVRFEGDYDHLARAGEWDDTETADAGKVGR